MRKTGVGATLQYRSDEQFRLMVESVQDYAIFMLDPEGHVATWNAGARRIKGYAADEIIGRHFSIFYPPADIASRKPWRELEIAAIEGRLEDEGWRIRQDGSRFWTNVVITALRDESGQLRGFAKVTRDLTERVRAEEERAVSHIDPAKQERLLREVGIGSSINVPPVARGRVLGALHASSTHLPAFTIERSQAEEARNLKLQTLVEHMAEGMIVIDDAGRILLANPTALQLLELRGPVEGVPLDELQLPAALCEALKHASEPGFPGPVQLLLSLGQTELEAYVSPVATDFGRCGALTLLKDVTLEVQLKRLQSSFVANVSHELRGPLATVSAVVEAFRDGLIGEDVRARYLTSVVAEIGRLRRLTDQLLELSKLDAGVVTLRAAEFDLGELCRVLGELWNYQCVNAGLHLTVDCPRIRMTADHDAVEQVLVNLLENAVRFTPAGGTILLSARVDGDRVAIAVADSGAGIPPEHIPYIWEPFYKADEARTLRPNSGTGLGLSIAKRLVDQMGGEIRVESEVNRRTVFQVFLPLA